MTSFWKFDKEIRLVDLVTILGATLGAVIWLLSLEQKVEANTLANDQNKELVTTQMVQVQESLRRIEGKMDQHLISHGNE